MANLFEPFFTTKETGEETGLELAKLSYRCRMKIKTEHTWKWNGVFPGLQNRWFFWRI